MKKIIIDQKECIGCNFCMNCDPSLFKFDEENFKGKLIDKNGNLTEILETELSPEQLKNTEEAIMGCPAQAISITEN